ncbi:MAG: phosphatase [Planctomycetes bacterium B3_Pla]|nr:MAG: phosphatase [Planctomycetes bacterium B3_Pla]
MSTEYVSGDLFVNRFGVEAFAHGCNCQGSMGAGIAKVFRECYPDMCEEYRRLCKSTPRQFNLGDSFLWKADQKLWVFNLGTQEHYWRCRASYQAITESLEAMRRQANEEGIRSIAMPRIGAGYGGLPWNEIRPIVEHVFSDWAGKVYVYEEFVPGQ